MLEVKEFGRAESALDGPLRGRQARIASKIHLAQRQLREFQRGQAYVASLVLRESRGAVGATIVERPPAQPGFPSHLFRSAWDVHWALRDGGIEPTFIGAARDESAATFASPSAA